MSPAELRPEPLQDRIAERLASMSPAERRVAEYIRHNSHAAAFASAEDIGAAAGVSDATVVRTAKSLGYSGLPELKRLIAHQVMTAVDPNARLHGRIGQVGAEPASLAEHVYAEAQELLAETHRLLTDDKLAAAVDLLATAGQVLCFGVGPSETVARYFALRLRRLGRAARATGATGFRLADDLLTLSTADVVLMFAPSRLLHDHDVLVDHAHKVGAQVVLVTDSLGPVLGTRVDIILHAVRSSSGFTGEVMNAMFVAETLAVSLTARDKDGSTMTAERLSALRSRLIDADSREHVRRARRRPR